MAAHSTSGYNYIERTYRYNKSSGGWTLLSSSTVLPSVREYAEINRDSIVRASGAGSVFATTLDNENAHGSGFLALLCATVSLGLAGCGTGAKPLIDIANVPNDVVTFVDDAADCGIDEAKSTAEGLNNEIGRDLDESYWLRPNLLAPFYYVFRSAITSTGNGTIKYYYDIPPEPFE